MGKPSSLLDEVFSTHLQDDDNYDEDTEGYTSASSHKSSKTVADRGAKTSKRKLSISKKEAETVPYKRACVSLTDVKAKPIKTDNDPEKKKETSSVKTRRSSDSHKRALTTIKGIIPSTSKSESSSSNESVERKGALKRKEQETVKKEPESATTELQPKVLLSQLSPSTRGQQRKLIKDKTDKKDAAAESKDGDRVPYQIKCEKCGQLFDNERKLKVHSAMHSTEAKSSDTQDENTQSEKFTCFVCKLECHDRDTLVDHLTSLHDKPYLCYIGNCRHACQTTNGLKLHMRSIHGETPFYPCPICSKRLKTEKARDHHADSCKAPKKKTEQCFHCFEVISDRQALRNHLASEHNIKQIVCQRCHSEVADADELQAHMDMNECASIVSKRKEHLDKQ